MSDDFDEFDEGGDNSANAMIASFIERMRKVNETLADARDDKKELYKEIVSSGFDRKAFDKAFKIIELDRAQREDIQEMKAVAALYLKALGHEEMEDLL